ncbi:FUSC family protein [Modestobacter sp. SSW1-42]|uniref:FUSC family protein n=1 Tax=Modestobacter sp. SSW1-42 TaxID=596372 RepID=UPI003985DEB2
MGHDRGGPTASRRHFSAPPLVRATARAGRPRTVAHRLRGSLPTVLQCAVAAAAAWWISETALGHQQPVFAATAAVVCLAAGAGQRARQTVDLLVGVLIGVFVGTLIRAVTDQANVWTTLLAVCAALGAIGLFDVRPLAFIQAGASALFVLTLPPVEAPADRVLDAAVGGALGLLASQVLVTPDPVHMVVGPARVVLSDAAAALRARDRTEAAGHARAATAGLGDLAAARIAARDVAARTVRGRLRQAQLNTVDRRLASVDHLVAATLLAVDPPRGAASDEPGFRTEAADVIERAQAALEAAAPDPDADLGTALLLLGSRPNSGKGSAEADGS